jgi:hypothetical protein
VSSRFDDYFEKSATLQISRKVRSKGKERREIATKNI